MRKMRWSITLMLAFSLVCLAACSDGGSVEEITTSSETGTTTSTTTTSAPTTTEPVDQLAIATELADAWIAGWAEEKDPAAVAALFTADGIYVSEQGGTFIGQEAIERSVAASPQPIDPTRIGDVESRNEETYLFRVSYGWGGATWVEDLELTLDGDHASRIAWQGDTERYLGLYEHLFDAEYSGTAELVAGDWCDEGWQPVEVTVTGTEADLGAIEATARHCTSEDATKVANGTVTIVTADGDELHGTYKGSVRQESDGTLRAQLVQTYDGGTGRFAEAKGVADEPCTVQFVSETEAQLSGVLRGTIEYDDSEA